MQNYLAGKELKELQPNYCLCALVVACCGTFFRVLPPCAEIFMQYADKHASSSQNFSITMSSWMECWCIYLNDNDTDRGSPE